MPCTFARLLLLSLTLLITAPASAGDQNEARDSLRLRLHAHDHRALDDWEPRLRELLQSLRDRGADGDSEVAITAMLRLLDAPRPPLEDGEPRDGRCRVRSLQANEHGAYLYPWFACSLWQEAGRQVFHKPTGSQRRFALLEREDADRLFFLGGMYFSDEEPRGYSSSYTTDPDPATRNRDSIGWLFKRDHGQYIVAFAPNALGFELYEMTTP